MGDFDKGISKMNFLKYLLNLHDYQAIHIHLLDPKQYYGQAWHQAGSKAFPISDVTGFNFQTTHSDTDLSNIVFFLMLWMIWLSMQDHGRLRLCVMLLLPHFSFKCLAQC